MLTYCTVLIIRVYWYLLT